MGASGLSLLVSTTVLTGWFTGNLALTKVSASGVSMKANTAAGLFLMGVALCLVAYPRARRWQLAIAWLAAVVVALLGMATILEYLLRCDLGIDQILVREPGPDYRPAPGRPAPGAATCFLFLGLSLLMLRTSRVSLRRMAESLALAALFTSSLALVGYVYGASSLYRLPISIAMSLNTAVTLWVVSVGTLYARGDFEIIPPLFDARLGGRLARKFLPAIFIIPLLGWLRLQGERSELYAKEFGLALFSVIVMAIFISLVWTSARHLNRIDAERTSVEEALRESERIYRAIGESIDYGVWLCEPDGKNVYVSPSFLELVGIGQKECSEFGWGDALHPEDAARTIAAWKECVRERGKWDMEHRFRGVDGQWHSVLARGVPVTDEKGNVQCWAGINLDISRLKAVEQQLRSAFDDLDQRIQERTAELTKVNEMLRKSLEEKEVLLSEVHHRVKNNLQVVSSLLHLQSLHSLDPSSVEMFQESRRRVRSMALVHEQLYRAKDLANVDFTDYIRGLANTLFQSYNIDSNRISLSTNAKDVRLSIDVAVPCGLLINELVSNCLKHAFVGRPQGHVIVELLAITDDEVLLRVADDGVGLPAEITPEATETFGMQVVTALVDQIHGRLDVNRHRGTEFRILFPKSSSVVKAQLT
jgi:PAS domain S-box-containing protein